MESSSILPETSTAFAPVVVTDPVLSAVPEVPVPDDAPSKGLAVSAPLYSAIRTSGYGAAVLNVTVTEFEPAATFFA